MELNLGPAVNPRDLEEGDDVYFECHIKAHPSAYKVTWKHNVRQYSSIPKTQYTTYPSREMPITTSHPGYSKIQFVNGLFRCQGLEIYPRPGDGKIISNQSLVIQKVAKEDAGNYTCQAFNVEGQMESQPQMLDIMCKFPLMQILKGGFPNSLHFVTNCQTILRLTNHKFCKMQISTGNSIMILYFDFSVH